MEDYEVKWWEKFLDGMRECEEMRKRPREEAKPKKVVEVKAPDLAGYVYLMRSDNGYHKIGMSKKTSERLFGVKRLYPVEIELIHQIKCHDRRKVEQMLHKKYRKQRYGHEWFSLAPGDVEWITSLRDYELG